MLLTPFRLAQNNNAITKTKTTIFLKITKLIFAIYLCPLAWILSTSSKIIINIIYFQALNKLGHALNGLK